MRGRAGGMGAGPHSNKGFSRGRADASRRLACCRRKRLPTVKVKAPGGGAAQPDAGPPGKRQRSEAEATLPARPPHAGGAAKAAEPRETEASEDEEDGGNALGGLLGGYGSDSGSEGGEGDAAAPAAAAASAPAAAAAGGLPSAADLFKT